MEDNTKTLNIKLNGNVIEGLSLHFNTAEDIVNAVIDSLKIEVTGFVNSVLGPNEALINARKKIIDSLNT